MLGSKQTFIGAGQTNILSRLNAHSWPCGVSLTGLECYASHVGKADVAIYKLINNRNMCWQQPKHTFVSTNIINIYSISPATLTSSLTALPFAKQRSCDKHYTNLPADGFCGTCPPANKTRSSPGSVDLASAESLAAISQGESRGQNEAAG